MGVLIPVNTFINVDLPAPFGPIIPNISPFFTPNVNYYNVGLSLIYSFSKYLQTIGSYFLDFSILVLSSRISYSNYSVYGI